MYNNPSSNLNLLKEALSEIEQFIGVSENILIIGDFNHQLQVGNKLEKFMQQNYELLLISPREPTTNAGTIIDAAFGKLTDFEADFSIYDSYFSFHKPLVIRIKEKQ